MQVKEFDLCCHSFVASFKNRKFWFRQNELSIISGKTDFITCLVRWSLDLSCSSDVKHFKSNSKMSTLSEDIKPPINTVKCCFIHHGLHKRKIMWRPWQFEERTAGLNRRLPFLPRLQPRLPQPPLEWHRLHDEVFQLCRLGAAVPRSDHTQHARLWENPFCLDWWAFMS